MDRKRGLNRAKDFSFVNPWIRYFLFFFSFVFWVFSLLIVAVGVYAKIQKATDAVRNTFLIDPAVILIVFSLSLTLVFLTQLAIAVLGFFYSEQTRDALGKFVKKAVVHYRDDLDLQNLMDHIQKEVLWSIPRLLHIPEHLTYTEPPKKDHEAAYVCCFGLAGGFPHVTDASCTPRVSSCDIPLPSAHRPGFLTGEAQTGRMLFTGCSSQQDHVSKYTLCSALPPSLSLFFSPSSNAAGGTTTQTGLGTCTLIVRMRTRAPSAVPCLTPAALLFLERL
ncbi:tetraspanin-33b isoform X2 [Gasterosteus aculeatus]